MMEWAVFAGILLTYGIKVVGVWIAIYGVPERRRPVRQEGLGRLPGEVSLNDFTAEERARLIQNLQRTQRRKKCPVPEKVNWKEEGF